MQLMASWLCIIKQAAGDVPEETAPAKTYNLNTMFQVSVTHGVLVEEHPERGALTHSAAPHSAPPVHLCVLFPCKRQEVCWSWGLSTLYPGTLSCIVP